MPPASGSLSPKRRVTDVFARFNAGSLAVCREGSVVALHVGTAQGIVVVMIGEGEFVRAARGPKDHNGNPFRSLKQIEEKPEAEETQALEELPLVVEPKRFSERARFDGRNKEFRRRCEAASADLAADRRLSPSDAALRHDILPTSFEEWLGRRQEFSQPRRALR